MKRKGPEHATSHEIQSRPWSRVDPSHSSRGEPSASRRGVGSQLADPRGVAARGRAGVPPFAEWVREFKAAERRASMGMRGGLPSGNEKTSPTRKSAGNGSRLNGSPGISNGSALSNSGGGVSTGLHRRDRRGHTTGRSPAFGRRVSAFIRHYKKQRPDRWLETPGFAPYLQAVSLEPANLTRAWRAVRCLTTGLRIPISLSGNSTSSTARVRPVDE